MQPGPLAEPIAANVVPAGPLESKFKAYLKSDRGRKASLLYGKLREGAMGAADVLTSMQNEIVEHIPAVNTYKLETSPQGRYILKTVKIPSREVIKTINHVASNLPTVPELNDQIRTVDQIYDTFKEVAWDQVKSMIPTPPIPFGGAIKNFVMDNATKVGPYIVDEVMDMKSAKGNLVWNIVLEYLFGDPKKPIKTSILK